MRNPRGEAHTGASRVGLSVPVEGPSQERQQGSRAVLFNLWLAGQERPSEAFGLAREREHDHVFNVILFKSQRDPFHFLIFINQM